MSEGPSDEHPLGYISTTLPPSADAGAGYQPGKFDPKAHEAKTARTLAFVLVWMLAGTFVLHELLVVFMTFHNKTDALPTLEHAFNQWLPVLAGLVGTAVGFYLKERK